MIMQDCKCWRKNYMDEFRILRIIENNIIALKLKGIEPIYIVHNNKMFLKYTKILDLIVIYESSLEENKIYLIDKEVIKWLILNG